ncbi:short-chain dehydrogenase/reductase [Sesbania bispinosa]|nr:short-chain dehydrogenase/reductase [Sesbania bispinosa]
MGVHRHTVQDYSTTMSMGEAGSGSKVKVEWIPQLHKRKDHSDQSDPTPPIPLPFF